MSTIHSNNKMGTTSLGEIGSSGLPNIGMAGASQHNSQFGGGMTGNGGDGGGSRILSAETIGDKQ